ncbi:MAG: hypothetical protein LBE71_02240 [Dysgonamonadaceae bacterium]|jgi:hypothetical protein|nr:hypothetical protein [Dysgonamonadaceae bacterium]
MTTTKIYKLPNKMFHLQIYDGETLIRDVTCPAVMRAVSNNSTNIVSIYSDIREFSTVSAKATDMEIDGVLQTDSEAVVNTLNRFIGTCLDAGEVYITEDAYNALTPEEQQEWNYVVI